MEYPTYVQTARWTHSSTEGDNPDSPVGTNEEISFQDTNGLNVNADISLSYHLEPQKIPAFYVKFRNDDIISFTHNYLRNVARDSFGSVSGRYQVEDLMGAKKEEFRQAVQKDLQEHVKDIGVVIDQLGFIESLRPPQSVMNAINLKVQAQQIALQKQNEVASAEADARKRVADADGQAKATIALAQGQAEANKDMAASITDNLIKWRELDINDRWIARWNGARPSVESGQGNGLIYQLPR